MPLCTPNHTEPSIRLGMTRQLYVTEFRFPSTQNLPPHAVSVGMYSLNRGERRVGDHDVGCLEQVRVGLQCSVRNGPPLPVLVGVHLPPGSISGRHARGDDALYTQKIHVVLERGQLRPARVAVATPSVFELVSVAVVVHHRRCRTRRNRRTFSFCAARLVSATGVQLCRDACRIRPLRSATGLTLVSYCGLCPPIVVEDRLLSWSPATIAGHALAPLLQKSKLAVTMPRPTSHSRRWCRGGKHPTRTDAGRATP